MQRPGSQFNHTLKRAKYHLRLQPLLDRQQPHLNLRPTRTSSSYGRWSVRRTHGQVLSVIAGRWSLRLLNECSFAVLLLGGMVYGNVNSQKKERSCYENPYTVHQFPLHNLKLTVWCVASGCRIIGPVFIEDTLSSYRKLTLKMKILQCSETSVSIYLSSPHNNH
jgi:hypothetical protein